MIERTRYSLPEAVAVFQKYTGNMIQHLLKNEDDGTFSLMRHHVCLHCDYCTLPAVAILPDRAPHEPAGIHVYLYRADPYKLMKDNA